MWFWLARFGISECSAIQTHSNLVQATTECRFALKRVCDMKKKTQSRFGILNLTEFSIMSLKANCVMCLDIESNSL